MSDEDRWLKLEGLLERVVRRIVREEIAALAKTKNKVDFVNGQWLGITDQLTQAWSSAYPAVDIQAELKKSAAWILSNPTLAPKSQFSRFLLTWFSRTQDRSAIRSIPTRNEVIAEKKKHCAYCEKVATGMTSGTWHCGAHWQDAIDGKPAGHMWGVTAKPVAGQ